MKNKKGLKIVAASSLAALAGLALVSCNKDKDSGTTGGDSDKSYTVSFNVNDPDTTDSTVPKVDNQTVKNGGTVTLTDLTYDGYTFEGWFTDSTLKTEFDATTKITSDITLYAKWSKNRVIPNVTKITMNDKTYDTITAALAAIPTSNDTNTYTIYLPKGEYKENGLSYNGTATVQIVGVTDTKYGADVVIKGRGNNMGSMRGRELLEIQGSGNIILENLTLESDYSRADVSGDVQAEVLGTDTKGNTVAYNCAFKSHQDTLRTAGKAWFYGCYIEGDTDFIWMEQAGKVALYEKCEIVSVYDENAKTHASYITAPRMAVSKSVGKGLVIFNSTVKEQNEAQDTYLARTPWSSGYYNQVAYINTTCSGINEGVWKGTQIATDYDKTVIGWKMDEATARSLGYAGNGDILDATTVSKEFSGRKAILNRVYNTDKNKYEKDQTVWDIDALIKENEWEVDTDSSKVTLDGEVETVSTTYLFDGTVDQSAMCSGFAQEGTKAHYVGSADSTITVPVSGKSYIHVYGYYQGQVEATATGQGTGVLFFNNGSTSSEIEQVYTVYDANVKNVVLTASAKTYITKIVVEQDSSIENVAVSSIDITASTDNYAVGVALTLSTKVNPSNATNKSVRWTSSNETIATIDEYTGKVTFKSAGEVTFTVTALDGSNVTNSIKCTPKTANWSEAEWYTTESTNLSTEDGAIEIGQFDAGSSQYKSLGTTVTFTNLAGETISTTSGLKLNGSGTLSFSTTKAATLTVVIVDIGKNLATDDLKVTNGTTTVSYASKDTTTRDGYITYTYNLTDAGTWTISRGGSKESNPIIYAKVEYAKTAASLLEYNVSTLENKPAIGNAVESTQDISFAGCVYATESTIALKEKNVVRLLLAKDATLTATMPNTTVKVYVNGVETALTDGKLVYTATAEGYVNITAEYSEESYATISSITVVKPITELTYDYANSSDKPAAGEAISSTADIMFINCKAHSDNKYIRLAGEATIKMYLAANTTLTLTTPYSKGTITINGTAIDPTSGTVTYNNTTEGFVTITGTNGYVTKIVVAETVVDTVISESTSIVFGTNNADLVAATTNNIIQGTTATVGNFTIDATASGAKLAFDGRTDNAQFNTGTKITFTVAAGATVKVVGYPGYFAYSINGVAATEADTTKTFDTETEVTVLATDNQYIKSIEVIFTTVISTSTFITYKGSSYAATDTATTTSLNHNDGTINKLTTAETKIDNITYTGCQSNGDDNWLTFNTGSTIKFNVSKACTLKIYYYQGTANATVSFETINVTTTTSSDGATYATAYIYPIADAGDVVITSTGNGYIGAIEIIFA